MLLAESFTYRWRRWRPKVIEWASLLFLIVLIIFPLSVLGWLAFATDTFSIQAITIVDARSHTELLIQEQTEVLVYKNILLIQPDLIEQSIKDSIFQIRDVHVARKLPAALKITVQEKQPALLLLSGGKYHFVDGQGIAYEEARLDTLPGIVLPVIKNTGAHTEVTLGTPSVNEGFVQFIQEAQSSVPDTTSGTIAEIRIPSLAAREVHFLMDTNWILKLDTSRPLAVQLGVLRRLLAHNIPEKDRDSLEYIDLRIPNRVYYKIKQSVAVPIEE